MYDNWIMIVIGLVLTLASFSAKHIADGMPPHHRKPQYPINRRVRVILFLFGLLFFTFGLVGALRN